MTVLRQRMLDDMRIRNLAAETQTSYLRQVAKFARCHGQSPALFGSEDIRTYQLHLLDDRPLAPTSVAGTVAGLRFLYQVTHKEGLGGRGPADAEARRDAAGHPESRGGRSVSRRRGTSQAPHDPHHVLRRRAATRRGAAFQVTDVDSSRMVLHVARGKGAGDRYVMLSPTLLQQLRAWWRVERPARWLFPGRRCGPPMLKGTVQWACRLARYRSRLEQAPLSHAEELRERRSTRGARGRRARVRRLTAVATSGPRSLTLSRRAPAATLVFSTGAPPASSSVRRTKTSAGTAILALMRAA